MWEDGGREAPSYPIQNALARARATVPIIQVTTRPSTYYRQFMSVKGVTVKADGTVDPAAVEVGAEIVASMLLGREDLARCMARSRAELAIIPRDRTLTSLPDYAHLKGRVRFHGPEPGHLRPTGCRSSPGAARLFDSRGAGAGQPRTGAPLPALPLTLG